MHTIVPSKRKHTSWTHLAQDAANEIETIDSEVVNHVQSINRDSHVGSIGVIEFKHPHSNRHVERLLSTKCDAVPTQVAALPVKWKRGKLVVKKIRVRVS